MFPKEMTNLISTNEALELQDVFFCEKVGNKEKTKCIRMQLANSCITWLKTVDKSLLEGLSSDDTSSIAYLYSLWGHITYIVDRCRESSAKDLLFPTIMASF